MAAARAAKAAKPAAVAVAEPPAQEIPVAEGEAPDSDNVMQQLAGLFSAAAGQKAGRDRAINDAMEILGKLDPHKYPDIADNPSVIEFVDRVQTARAQQQGLRPGSYIGNPNSIAGKKVLWTWGDLNKTINWTDEEVVAANARGEIAFPWVLYRPMHTRTIIWNGLRVYFRARQQVKVCKVFVDTYEEALNQEEFAEQHAAWLFNVPGAQTHRDFFTTNGPRVKAMDESRGDYFKSGGGMISLATSQGEDTGSEE
jgi:hypothetical protein